MTDDREPIEKVRDELKALSSVEIYSPSSYTMELEGKVRALTARLAAAEALLREAAIKWELGVDTCGMRQVRLPKEWYARTLKTGVLPAPAAKGWRDE